MESADRLANTGLDLGVTGIVQSYPPHHQMSNQKGTTEWLKNVLPEVQDLILVLTVFFFTDSCSDCLVCPDFGPGYLVSLDSGTVPNPSLVRQYSSLG